MTEETSVIRIYVEPSVYAKMATTRAYHDRPLSVLQAAMDAFLVEIHPQPSQELWNGEGLPPVGAEIEALLPGLGSSRFWQQAKVVHGPLPDSPGEILVFSLENTRPSWVDEFRPLRTPEQIAAEEREKAVVEMEQLIGGAKTWPEALRRIHDAGYRKTTE